MPSLPYLLALLAAVVLVGVVVLVVAALLRARRRSAPLPAPPADDPVAPRVETPADIDLFRPARPARHASPVPLNLASGPPSPTPHPPDPAAGPPDPGPEPSAVAAPADLPMRVPAPLRGASQWPRNGRPLPADGIRELVAAAAGQAPPSLRGVIRGDDGAPLADAVLTVINVTGGQAGMTRTGSDGRYRLEIPEEGSYIVIVRGAYHQPHASTVDVHRPYTVCDLRLNAAAGLAGTVSDRSGELVRGATVILTSTSGAVVAARRSNERGGFTVADVPAGTYTLTVTATGFDPVATTIEIPGSGMARCDPVLGADRHVALHGVVVHDDDGRPLSDIRVRLIDADGRHVATVHTGPDGRYEFAGLDGGRYLVLASGYPEVAGEVELAGEREHEVRMGWSEPVRVGAEGRQS